MSKAQSAAQDDGQSRVDRRFALLLRQLRDEFVESHGGREHGWEAWASRRVGISQSMTHRLGAGDRGANVKSIVAAITSFGIPAAFFFGDQEPGHYRDFSEEAGAMNQAALTVLTINFQSGAKWRFSDGDHSFWATMEDSVFSRKIDEDRASFGKHDVVICQINRRQFHDEKGLRSEYAVVKVLRHRPAMRQIHLLAPEDMDGNSTEDDS